MSHFLYIHKDLSNVKGVWKVGVAMTPYSAVRARQKFCWNKFSLDYLYFGLPEHVSYIEKTIKQRFRHLTGSQLQGNSANTEMLKIDINTLRKEIEMLIVLQKLKVTELVLDAPYGASKSSDCPFGIPTESWATYFLENKAKKFFSPGGLYDGKKTKISSKQIIKEVFAAC